MGKYYEADLPCGYTELYHIDAKNKKIGLIFNLISLLITVIIMAIAVLCIFLNKNYSPKYTDGLSYMSLIFLGFFLVYIVLHELVHGVAYKALTKQKLTFGISWSCAFCGVPNIFTYRITALVALLAPFTLFSLILLPICIVLYFINPFYFLFSALLFGLHFGGCSGDLYMTILLLTKYKDKSILVKDTGPEQFIYGK